jgi:hypothetical protein
MKKLLALGSIALFLGAYGATLYAGEPWWLYLVWLLAPDLSMIGYAFGPRVGAFTYNLAHHQGVAVLVIALGAGLHHPQLLFAGWVLLGHSAMDRIFGYGLKYPDAFKHTHLGWIGGGVEKSA